MEVQTGELEPLDAVATALEKVAFVQRLGEESHYFDLASPASRMVALWLSPAPARVVSVEAEADSLGTTPRLVRKFRQLSASATHLVCMKDIGKMLRQLTDELMSQGAKCLLWTEKLAADETSLPLTVLDCETRGAVGLRSSMEATVLVTKTLSKQASPSKILQTVREYAVLHELQDGTRLHVDLEVPVPLHILSSTRSEVYYPALMPNGPDFSAINTHFTRRQRLAMTDGDASIALALRGVERSSGVATLGLKCDIHKVSYLVTAVMEPMGKDISSMIHLQLSLQSANSMRLFRDALRSVVEERLVYTKGRPLHHDLARSRLALDICLPATTGTNRLKRALLLTLFNGDWSSTDVVEHKCTGCCLDRTHCVERAVSIAVLVFAACAPATWPRSRWTGAREAANWLLLLQSCHGLLVPSYLSWASKLRGGEWVARFLENPSDGVVPQDDGEGDAGVDAEGPDHDSRPAGEPPATEAVLPGSAADHDQDPSGDTWQKRQREQAQHRLKACRWLLCDRWEESLVAIRLCMGPMASLMDA